VIRDEVSPRGRHQGGELFDELLGFEHQRMGPVVPRPAQAVGDAAVGQEREPLGGNGRSGHVPDQVFQRGPVAPVEVNVCMQGEPLCLGASLPGERHIRRIRIPPHTGDPVSPLDGSGIASAEMRGLEGDGVLFEDGFFRNESPQLKQGQHPGADSPGDLGDILVRGFGKGMKLDRLEQGGPGIEAVKYEG